MTTGAVQRLTVALALLMALVAIAPAAAGAAPGRVATVNPPGGASPIGAPVAVTRAGGGVDQLQLFTGGSIYPNIPGANLWYLPHGGTAWVEVQCCIPADIAPTVVAAESADGRIEAFVAAPGGIGFTGPFFHDYESAPGGTWQLEGVGNAMKRGFGGGGAPVLFKAADGRLHFFGFDAAWQIAHFSQTVPGGPWGAWQLLGQGPFAMPVTMIGTTVSESSDGTLTVTGSMIGAPVPGCTATTSLAPGQSTWSAWQVGPTVPAACPRRA